MRYRTVSAPHLFVFGSSPETERPFASQRTLGSMFLLRPHLTAFMLTLTLIAPAALIAAEDSQVTIRSQLDTYLFDDASEIRRQELLANGEALTPFLIEELGRQRTQSGDINENAPQPFSPYTFSAVAELIESVGGEDAISALEPYVKHEVKELRYPAVRTIAALGHAASASTIRSALVTADAGIGEAAYSPANPIRASAIAGVRSAIEKGRATKEYKEMVFPAVAGALKEYDQPGTAELLLALDRAEAIKTLATADFLTAKRPQSAQILRALTSIKHPVPAEMLKDILRSVDVDYDLLAADFIYTAALIAYVSSGHEDAVSREISQATKSTRSKIRRAAKTANAMLRVNRYRRRLLEWQDRTPAEKLTDRQRLFLAVTVSDGAIRQRGISDFLMSSTASDLNLFVRGLREMSEIARVQEFDKLTSAFGIDVSGDTDAQRVAKLGNLSAKEIQRCEAFDFTYIRADQSRRIDETLVLFAKRHAGDFPDF